jgi:Icc-related predicted phosphoesterase
MPFGRGRPKKRPTRIFFATDLHGSERTFRKFVNAGRFYGVDVLVMGGDIMGKLALPIIHEGGERYRVTLHGRVEHFEGQATLQAMEDRIAFLGFYSQVMEPDEYAALQADPAAVERLFHDLAAKRLSGWVDVVETRLKGSGLRCYATGGNDDVPAVMELLEHASGGEFRYVEHEAVQIDDDHTMVSLAYTNPTPWHTPREASEEELWSMIEGVTASVPDRERLIFNFHAPPKDSTLDICPTLDWTTDPPTQILVAGQTVPHGAGSTSVRRAIETLQPMLGLHGHIHESQAATRIGRTVCLNPGSEYGEGVLHGAIVSISEGKVESYQMTCG